MIAVVLASVALAGGGVAAQAYESSSSQEHTSYNPDTLEQNVRDAQTSRVLGGLIDRAASGDGTYTHYSDAAETHSEALNPPQDSNAFPYYSVVIGGQEQVEQPATDPSSLSTMPLFGAVEQYAGLLGNLLPADPLGQLNLDLGLPEQPSMATDTTLGESPDVLANAPAVAPKPAATFNVATFNVLGNNHTARGGNLAKWPSGIKRFARAMDVLKSNNIDVVGLQEFQKEQRKVFVKQDSNEWGIAPKKAVWENKFSENSIIWKLKTFKLIDSGKDEIKYFDGEKVDTPWVKLRHRATGKEVIVMNTHDPVTSREHGSNVAERIADAIIHRKDAARRSKDTPVILVGDFNSAFAVRRPKDGKLDRNRLPYCILTATGHLANSYDVAGNKAKAEYYDEPWTNVPACPTKQGNVIDHVYVSDEVMVNDWRRLKDMPERKISDHNPTITNVTVR